MPQKINSKNLSYNSQPPPFLAALQAQAAGHGSPDAIAAGRRRPGKKRSGSEEAEDAPLVVDEHGNAVAVDVDKDGIVKAGRHDDDPSEDHEKKAVDKAAAAAYSTEKTKREPEAKASSIGGRKRKVGKVVGGGDAEGGAEEDRAGKGDGVAAGRDAGATKDAETAADNRKPKKKAKKIKLSFDED